MEKRIALYQKIKREKLIAVIRTDSKEDARKIIDAAVEGGINIIEITMTIPGAMDLIKEVKNHYKDTVCVGAGTVLSSEAAQNVIDAGSEFVVTPHFDEEIIKLCHLCQVFVIPGTIVLKDMVQALKLGCTLIKLFPANLLGVNAIRSFKGPLPDVEIIPTGGVISKPSRIGLMVGRSVLVLATTYQKSIANK